MHEDGPGSGAGRVRPANSTQKHRPLPCVTGPLIVVATLIAGVAGAAPARIITSAASQSSAPHIMIVMMENKNYESVIGNPAAPFTNRLASNFGLATESFALAGGDANYLALVSGSTLGVGNVLPSQRTFPSTPTLADELLADGYTAKAYAENLPANPLASTGEYDVQHFPWAYFPNAHIPEADGSSLIKDLDSPSAPDFVWYTPNVVDDQHDGSLQQGDAWLAAFIPAVLTTKWYADGGQIIIEWDESHNETSGVNGSFRGGHVATIVVSSALAAHPQQFSGQVDTVGILRSIEDQYELGYVGDSANPKHGDIDSLLNRSAQITDPQVGGATTITPPLTEAARHTGDQSSVRAKRLVLILLAFPLAGAIGLAIRGRRDRSKGPAGVHAMHKSSSIAVSTGFGDPLSRRRPKSDRGQHLKR